MASIFSKIIAREIPGQFIYEDEVCVALMDKFPAIPGQALIIPKVETSYILDLDDATYTHLFALAKRVAGALDTVFEAERTCYVVEGFEVPHVHIKLYPMPDTSIPLGAQLANGKIEDDDILEEQAGQIKAALA
mgnify:CR=1 FL=1